MKRIIYDFGSNNGDDIPYYLKKADMVVAVEAAPKLAERIRTQFSAQIATNKLAVVNAVLSDKSHDGDVPFYIHKTNHVLSQFLQPDRKIRAEFEMCLLPSRRASDIIKSYGPSYYVKIDVEHFDQAILAEIFAAGIRPDFISAEAHSVEVFASLIVLGGYRAFKLVEGESVHTRFANHRIKTRAGNETYSFPPHSAGPFGRDIPGEWMTPDNLFYFLAKRGLGWADIHATNTVKPDPSYMPMDDAAPASISRPTVPLQGQPLMGLPAGTNAAPSRNAPCPCGSGKRYKNCQGALV